MTKRSQQADDRLGVLDLPGVDQTHHIVERHPLDGHRLLLGTLAIHVHRTEIGGQEDMGVLIAEAVPPTRVDALWLALAVHVVLSGWSRTGTEVFRRVPRSYRFLASGYPFLTDGTRIR